LRVGNHHLPKIGVQPEKLSVNSWSAADVEKFATDTSTANKAQEQINLSSTKVPVDGLCQLQKSFSQIFP
jgi:coenzyme F420-reducing hydrogenase delta subunit